MTKDEQEVLAANQAFYAAFAARDAAAMESLWAHEAELACLHPGWELLLGREEVLRSWRGILLGGGAPADIHCERAGARVAGDAAWDLCPGGGRRGGLALANLLLREGRRWRSWSHPASRPPPPAA